MIHTYWTNVANDMVYDPEDMIHTYWTSVANDTVYDPET